MKILVTGSTGFIGYAVSNQLSQSGLNPRLMIRRGERGRLLNNLEAELVEADITDRSSLTNALKDVDTVIHLGARATFEKYSSLKEVNVEGTYNLFEECTKSDVSNFVFCSSMFVYSDSNKQIDENTVPHPAIDYGRAKLEVENWLFGNAGRIKVACVRLPHVYGTQDLLFGQVRKGYLLCPGNGENIFSHMHVKDAARVLIEVALQGWTGASPVADDKPATWNQFFEVMQHHYNRFRIFRIPEGLASFGGMVLRQVYSLFGKPNIYTEDTVTGFNLNLAVKPGLLWNDLGISPNYPTISDGIPQVLDDFIAYRWEHPVMDKS